MRNNTYTHNMGVTHSTSFNEIVDLFFLIGATRNMSDEQIIDAFNAALVANPIKALKILFYARDIEKGLGERRVFRIIITHLAKKYPDFIKDNLLNRKNILDNIVRVDDLVYIASQLINERKNKSLIDDILMFLLELLNEETEIQGIVAKWMPRKNSQYGNVVRYMRKHGFISTYSEYRKFIVSLSNTVEQVMSRKDIDAINLEHVPSVAMSKYSKAFDRYGILEEYVEKVAKGEAKLHARQLFPYQIAKEALNSRSEVNSDLLEQQWQNLKELDVLNSDFRAIPVIDVSGSMTWSSSGQPNPIEVALGLGLYLAENNPNDAFKDYFVTFSQEPKFQEIYGSDIKRKMINALKADWGYNTNIEAVFKLILDRAVKGNVPQGEMPSHILIFSDMEFDHCVDMNENAYEMIVRRYEETGYDLPQIVFWNVNGRPGNVPVQMNDKNAILVSGASQNVINFVLRKGYADMMGLVNEIVNNERYSHIK